MIKAANLQKSKVLQLIWDESTLKNTFRVLREAGYIASAHDVVEIRPLDVPYLLYALSIDSPTQATQNLKLTPKDEFIYDLANYFSILRDAIAEMKTGREYANRIDYIENEKNLLKIENILISDSYQKITKNDGKITTYGDFKNDRIPVRCTLISRWFLLALFFDIISEFQYGELLIATDQSNELDMLFKKGLTSIFETSEFKKL